MRSCCDAFFICFTAASFVASSPVATNESRKFIAIKGSLLNLGESDRHQISQRHESFPKYSFQSGTLSRDEMEVDLISLTNATGANSSYQQKDDVNKRIRNKNSVKETTPKKIILGKEGMYSSEKDRSVQTKYMLKSENESLSNSLFNSTDSSYSNSSSTFFTKGGPFSLNTSTHLKRNRTNDKPQNHLLERKNANSVSFKKRISTSFQAHDSKGKNKTSKEEKISLSFEDNNEKYNKTFTLLTRQDCKQERSSIGDNLSSFCKQFLAVDAQFNDDVNKSEKKEAKRDPPFPKKKNSTQIKTIRKGSGYKGRDNPKDLSNSQRKGNTIFSYNLSPNNDKAKGKIFPKIIGKLKSESLGSRVLEKEELGGNESYKKVGTFSEGVEMKANLINHVRGVPFGKPKRKDKKEKGYRLISKADTLIVHNDNELSNKTVVDKRIGENYTITSFGKLNKTLSTFRKTPKSEITLSDVSRVNVSKDGDAPKLGKNDAHVVERNAILISENNGSKLPLLSLSSYPQSKKKKLWRFDYESDVIDHRNLFKSPKEPNTEQLDANGSNVTTHLKVELDSTNFTQLNTNSSEGKTIHPNTTTSSTTFAHVSFLSEISESSEEQKEELPSHNYQTTTQTGEYDDYLIPPLPDHWPGEEKRSQNSVSTYDKKEKENISALYSSENYTSDTKHQFPINTNKNRRTPPYITRSFQKVYFTGRKNDRNILNERQGTNTEKGTDKNKLQESSSRGENGNTFSMTKLSGENLSENPRASLNKNYSEGRLGQRREMVKIGDTAPTNEPAAPSYAKERISFITLPPATQWHLWSSFTGRRRVDPFFEFPNTNATSDITQVYTAYWGGSNSNTRGIAGVWILRLGAGVALLTLVSTIFAQTLRFCQPLLSQKAVITTNLATSLGAAHVVFIFGIQATDGVWTCGVAALFLHFLYLLTCNWLLALSIRLLRSLLQKKPIPTVAYCIPVWIASLAVVVVSYGVNPSGYETRRFCWLSIERGMLFAFIGPVCTLLMVNAGVCIASQKVLLDAGGKTDPSDKRDLRAGVVLLPLHGVAWFLTVVALEDDLSLALDAASAVTTVLMGLFTLHFYVPTWQFFLEFLSPYQSSSTSPGTATMSLTRVQDSANLPLLHTRIPIAQSNPSTSPSVVEEYQLEPIFLANERKNAY